MNKIQLFVLSLSALCVTLCLVGVFIAVTDMQLCLLTLMLILSSGLFIAMLHLTDTKQHDF